MKYYLLPSLWILAGIFWISCGEKPLEPDDFPVRSKRVKYAQFRTETGYNVELSIPWQHLELEASEGLLTGLEVIITDDDDGGLSEQKLSWHPGQDTGKIPFPYRFGTFTLSGENDSLMPGEARKISELIFVDGKEDDSWQEIEAVPVGHVLTGDASSTEDFGGTMKVAWDTFAIHLFIEVTDDSVSVDSRTLTWEDDGVAVYIDPTLARDKNLNPQTVWGFRILPGVDSLIEDNYPFPPEWTVSILEVYDGGPGLDGIPALENPAMTDVEEATYLFDDDLVIGYVHGNEARAYPHRILDWHEIVNDQIGSFAFAITYCPLTGSGMGWNRTVNGWTTTFGVSGLLFKSNLIPYDRQTGSNWSQIFMDCLQGERQGVEADYFPVVETRWGTWKDMYPGTKVLSKETGHDRNYAIYPYGDYRTNHDYLISPVQPDDTRLPRKERVHGLILNNQAKVYPLSLFGGNGPRLIDDEFLDQQVIVAGSRDQDFMVSFSRQMPDGTILKFSPSSGTDPAIIMQDQEGNEWNILGTAIAGPRQGQQLPVLKSFTGYWFSFAAFFPGAEIYL